MAFWVTMAVCGLSIFGLSGCGPSKKVTALYGGAANLERLRVADDFRLLQGYSTDDDILEQASDVRYDLVIIDADHSYDGIRLDFERYADVVDKDGLLIVDDYGTDDWPDVQRYTDEVIRYDPRFDFVGAASRTAVFRRGVRDLVN